MGGFGPQITSRARNAVTSLPQNMQAQDLQGTGGIRPMPQQQYGGQQQSPQYAGFPPYGGSGYGNRYGRAMFGGNPYGGYFGGGGYGMGGFPMGNMYGPGSYSPYGAGMMGYGGGSGMFGGPMRGYSPYGGPQGWAQGQVGGGYGQQGYNPMNVVNTDQAGQISQLQSQIQDLMRRRQTAIRDPRDQRGRGDGPAGAGGNGGGRGGGPPGGEN